MNQRLAQRFLWTTLAISLLLIGGLSVAGWIRHQPHESLHNFGAVPEWTLVDQAGRTQSLKDFRGHIWVANTIFTHCSSICPMLTSKMFALQQELKDQPDVKLASFTVDPKHDTPDTLAAYAKAHGANPAQWSFLTGSSQTIYHITKDGFHLPLDSVGGDQAMPIIHSPRFVLIDARGNMRGYYDGQQDESRGQILADIATLKEEASH